MPLRPCIVCGVATPAARCPTHAIAATHSTHNRAYEGGMYRRVRDAFLRNWRYQHGNLCPGYDRPPHTDGILSLDHVIALADGGSLTDRANFAVLCTVCNARKGASKGGGGAILKS